jgi:hypothetical protein
MAAAHYEPYQPREFLGKGNFGEVEKLKHRSDDKMVDTLRHTPGSAGARAFI